MNCNNCEFYYGSVISFLDSNNVETDLGTRLIQCSKKKEELIIKDNYTNVKSKETCNIGIIKLFDCDKKFKFFTMFDIQNNDEIIAPNWCPKKKK